MVKLSDEEKEIIKRNAGKLTSTEMAKKLENKFSASSIRSYCSSIGLTLKKNPHSKANIELAIGMRQVGFTRKEILASTGLPRATQDYYEKKVKHND